MKVIVVGAGGKLGSRVLAASVRAGHDTTAFVRKRERLRTAIGDDLLSRVAVVEGDANDKAQLVEAMRGHDAAVQVTGGIFGRGALVSGTVQAGPFFTIIVCVLELQSSCGTAVLNCKQ